MLEDSYDIKALSQKQLSPQELADRLLFKAPSRGWNNYGGLDDTLRIAIKIANEHLNDSGSKSLVDQYGTATIISDMQSLRSTLNVLAKDGPAGLSFEDKRTLGVSKLTLDGMIRQTLIIAEANRPGRLTALSSDTPSADNNGYWEKRIHAMTRTAHSQANEYNDYSSSKQFSHYLIDTQKILSSICYELGIQQIQQRHH